MQTFNSVVRRLSRRPFLLDGAIVPSPHSFRVTTITGLLEQGVPLEDVRRLAGHTGPRTTRLYGRRQKRITRDIGSGSRFRPESRLLLPSD
ncbi:MAG: tyrosine-type recombinase/integrase [Acidobacteria bacterium]|nr:tyrosine-type recombinase/integrase [Acidobacteriota bacterium]